MGKLPAAKQQALLYESLNHVELGAMPPQAYTRLHPEAALSRGQLQTLEVYLNPPQSAVATPSQATTAAAQQYAAWLAQNTAGRSTASAHPAPNGLAFFADYRDWKPISTTERFDNDTLRVILGNSVAQRALAANQIHPWPDGTAFAKLAWDQLVDADGSVRSGAFKQVEFMLKDATKYASTEGWGFGRWLGTALAPYGKDADFARECTGCHAPMAANDFVYTLPITQQGAAASAPFVNSEALLPASLVASPLTWRVIASRVDPLDASMSTLYGNDLAVEHARSQPVTTPYPPGASLSLVVWAQQRDAHWFGAKLPGKARSIETVTTTATGSTTSYAYQRSFGVPPAQSSAQAADAARIAFIVAQQASVMP
jgi:hypothetical protein